MLRNALGTIAAVMLLGSSVDDAYHHFFLPELRDPATAFVASLVISLLLFWAAGSWIVAQEREKWERGRSQKLQV